MSIDVRAYSAPRLKITQTASPPPHEGAAIEDAEVLARAVVTELVPGVPKEFAREQFFPAHLSYLFFGKRRTPETEAHHLGQLFLVDWLNIEAWIDGGWTPVRSVVVGPDRHELSEQGKTQEIRTANGRKLRIEEDQFAVELFEKGVALKRLNPRMTEVQIAADLGVSRETWQRYKRRFREQALSDAK